MYNFISADELIHDIYYYITIGDLYDSGSISLYGFQEMHPLETT